MDNLSSPPSTPIIFFGTSGFAVPVLELLVKNKWPVKLVITQPDQPIGRHQKLQPPPVKIAAQKLNLKILQPSRLDNWKLGIGNWKLFVVCAYGKLIPADILKIPKYGTLNIHPSLLPKYRGPSPIQTALLNGDKETGISLMLLDEEMDHGPLLAQQKTKIRPDETCLELSERLSRLGTELLLKTLPDYLSGKIKPQPQNHSQATFTKILTREDGKVDWNKSAEEIERMVRAFEGWPETYTSWDGKRLKILKAETLNPKLRCAENALPGQVSKTTAGKMAISCGVGSLIIEDLQLEGKNKTRGEDFLRGHSLYPSDLKMNKFFLSFFRRL